MVVYYGRLGDEGVSDPCKEGVWSTILSFALGTWGKQTLWAVLYPELVQKLNNIHKLDSYLFL